MSKTDAINAFCENPPDGPPPGSREVRGQPMRRWHNGVFYDSSADAWRAWLTDYLDTDNRLWWVELVCRNGEDISFEICTGTIYERSRVISFCTANCDEDIRNYLDNPEGAIFTTFDAACEAARAMIDE